MPETSGTARPDLSAVIFCEVVAEYFDFEASDITPDSRLFEDLGFDSIMFVELELLLEEVAGHEVPPDFLAEIRTIDDVYHYYLTFLGQTGRTVH